MRNFYTTLGRFYSSATLTMTRGGHRTKLKVANERLVKYDPKNNQKRPSLAKSRLNLGTKNKANTFKVVEDTLTSLKSSTLKGNSVRIPNSWESLFPSEAGVMGFIGEKKFPAPLEIQKLLIPCILSGKNVFGGAETGSGKTLSYLLPLCLRLKKLEQENKRGLVMVAVPTIELVNQIKLVAKDISHFLKLRIRTMFDFTKSEMMDEADVLIGLPNQFVFNTNALLGKQKDFLALVIDEADTLLIESRKRFPKNSNFSSFSEDCKLLMEAFPSTLQKVVVSATMPPSLLKKLNALIPVIDTS